MFPNSWRVAGIATLGLALFCGCGTDNTPPDNAAGTSGASGASGNGTNAGGAGGTGGTNASGSAGTAAGNGGAAGPSANPSDPCVLAITMRSCCWSHLAARQSQVDSDPCIADHPLDISTISRDLDLQCRAAQSPPCDPEMNICTLGFSPPPTAAREAEDGSCVLTG